MNHIIITVSRDHLNDLSCFIRYIRYNTLILEGAPNIKKTHWQNLLQLIKEQGLLLKDKFQQNAGIVNKIFEQLISSNRRILSIESFTERSLPYIITLFQFILNCTSFAVLLRSNTTYSFVVHHCQLPADMAKTVASALVNSRFDYANAVLYCTSEHKITMSSERPCSCRYVHWAHADTYSRNCIGYRSETKLTSKWQQLHTKFDKLATWCT